MSKKKNYAMLPEEYSSSTSKIYLVPVPYDGTSSWLKGADKGPDALIEASCNMELYDIETDSEVFEHGIYTDEPVDIGPDPETMVTAVKKRVASHLKNDKFTVVLGGEHSVSIGTIQAHAEKFKDLTVLQLDAHTDLRQEYEGTKFGHADVMARACECSKIVQVGIRSMSSEEKEFMNPANTFFTKDIAGQNGWQEKVLEKLGKKVYVTIDLDVFDPSIMPSTGTPEPGGLGWYEVLDLLKRVAHERELVGFDVVELCPNEINKAPDFLAAKLVYKFLNYKFA